MFSHKMLKMANFSHSPCKIRDCIFTTCCTIIYKHIYNPNANTRSLFLSSITTLIAEIPVQGEKMRENKRREERNKKRKGRRRERRRPRRGVQKKNKLSNLSFSKIH
jgi:hypothetical protein